MANERVSFSQITLVEDAGHVTGITLAAAAEVLT